MTDPTMSDDERVLLKHRWAVGVNLPTDARHAATIALRLVDVVRYAGRDGQAEVKLAAVRLQQFAGEVERQVAADRRAGALQHGRCPLPAHAGSGPPGSSGGSAG